MTTEPFTQTQEGRAVVEAYLNRAHFDAASAVVRGLKELDAFIEADDKENPYVAVVMAEIEDRLRVVDAIEEVLDYMGFEVPEEGKYPEVDAYLALVNDKYGVDE